MVELLVARKKDSNLIFRNIKRKKEQWSAEDFGSSAKDSNFEMVIKNKDSNLLAYLLFDLNRLGFNIDKAIVKYRELMDKPDLFFLN